MSMGGVLETKSILYLFTYYTLDVTDLHVTQRGVEDYISYQFRSACCADLLSLGRKAGKGWLTKL
jgi:hypothetical protein